MDSDTSNLSMPRLPQQQQHKDQAWSTPANAQTRVDSSISDADLAKYGAEFLVPYDADQPGPQVIEMNLPLYNPNCWPVDWIADMVARGKNLDQEPIRVPHHPDAAPDSPFVLNFCASAYGVIWDEAQRLNADLAKLREPQPLVTGQRKKYARASRGGVEGGSVSSVADGLDHHVLDSDGDVVMVDPGLTMSMHESERHSVESFRAELSKDPSGKVTLSSPPPPQHLLPPRSFTYHSGLIFSSTCPPPDPAFLLGCDCTYTRPCILPSGRVNLACKHGDDAYGHTTAPSYTLDGRLRSLVQLQNSTFLPVTSPFVIECNVNCPCANYPASASASAGAMCKNRVAQNGIQYRLVIGHASGKGLGVFAAERIPQGAFVVEYAGEVLTQAELNARDEEWVAKAGGASTYSFNADWMVDGSNDEEMAKVKAIEARHKGNCSRFFNHSCSPNLIVGAIQYDMDDSYMHRIGFFALRDIVAGEELAFDYHGGDKSNEQAARGGVRGSRRSAVAKVGRKRTVRRRSSGGVGAASARSDVHGVEADDEDEDGLTGLYKFRCLCGSETCRGNVL